MQINRLKGKYNRYNQVLSPLKKLLTHTRQYYLTSTTTKLCNSSFLVLNGSSLNNSPSLVRGIWRTKIVPLFEVVRLPNAKFRTTFQAPIRDNSQKCSCQQQQYFSVKNAPNLISTIAPPWAHKATLSSAGE